ncbi:hypothetical protein Tco_1069302 [Tanacetum coccineum]|uniref:Uncharacterized protein n=1 Tax=Tanacetum coccineum TaxID=301880 RepID=A0ABQ5HK08_9ASTR
MAQQIIIAAQLVPKFQGIGRCNNYDVLQSIPCSPECKIVGKILLDHPLSYALTANADAPVVYLQRFWRIVCKVPDTKDTIKFKLDTQEITYTLNMFHDTLKLLVETLNNPFITPKTIRTIESFMQTVGYQDVVDKVSAFYTKFLAQPCSPECKIVGQILLDHPLSYALTATADVPAVYLQQFWRTVCKVPDTKDTIRFKLDTQEITYMVNMFCDTLKLPVETRDNPFITPVTIRTIESFMQMVGYQGVVDKDFMNNVFQKKDVIQYPRFTKFIIADLMKKYLSIPQRHDEDYHSIKDDIPLVSVYSTGNVLFQGMRISDAFFTKEIRATDDYKEYETVFFWVEVPMNQPQPVVSTQGTHRSTPRAQGTPTLTTAREQDVKSYDDKFVASMIHDDVDDFGDRIEPESHKEHPEVDDDDDDNKEEKKDEKEGDEMGKLTDIVSLSTTTTSKDTHKKRRISSKYSHLLGALRRMCKFDQVLHEIVPQLAERATNDLIESNLKPIIVDTIIQDHDAFRSEEWDAWEVETIIDEDKVIPEDETPELITEFQNVDKRVLTIFDCARIEATLNDMLSNQFRNAKEYAYHLEQATNFMENQINGNTEEKKYIISLHKIHAERFIEADLEEILNRWVRKEFKNFNEDARLITKVVKITTDQQYGLDFMEQIIVMRANDKPDSFSKADFKYLNKNDIEDLYYLYRNKKVNYRETKLMNSLITFIRSRVIWERVHDFQLGIERYQIKVNLTAPTLTFPGIEEHEPYLIIDKTTTCLIYLNNKNEKLVMYLVEIVKFCDATLEKS